MLKASASRRPRCAAHAPRSAESIAVTVTKVPAASQDMPLCAPVTRCASTEERSDADSSVSESSDGTRSNLGFSPGFQPNILIDSKISLADMKLASPSIHVNVVRQCYIHTNLLHPSRDNHNSEQPAQRPAPPLTSQNPATFAPSFQRHRPRFSSRLPSRNSPVAFSSGA
jgi:hypothetical protein